MAARLGLVFLPSRFPVFPPSQATNARRTPLGETIGGLRSRSSILRQIGK